MRHISDGELAEVMSVADFVASCDEAFRLYGKGNMVNPAREETVAREGDMDLFRLVLPGEWVGKFRGQKVLEERSDVKTGRLGERTAVIELNDLETGEQVVMDAEHITNMRTGAAGALGAKYLAKKVVQTVAILGTGRIAQALARCVDVALGPKVMRATSRTAEKRDAFHAEIEADIYCDLTMVEDVVRCIDGVDAIFASVPTPRPIVNDVEAGVHISVMGGDGRTTQLASELLTRRFVVPDHSGQVMKSGEFLALEKLVQKPRWVRGKEGQVLDMGNAALGQLEDRRGQGSIAYFSGMAIQDVHAGAIAWSKLR